MDDYMHSGVTKRNVSAEMSRDILEMIRSTVSEWSFVFWKWSLDYEKEWQTKIRRPPPYSV